MNILEYENYKERTAHGNPDFPYITYPCSIPLDFPSVPLHWHEEAEIIYFKKGKGILTIDFNRYEISAGAIALILPGQLHSIDQCESKTPASSPMGKESMEYENIIFKPSLLLSKQNDICSTNFIAPIFTGELAVPSIYTPDMPGYPAIAACIDANDDASDKRPFGYPLIIKGQLFLFFSLILQNRQKDAAPKTNHKSLDKMKVILKYVENHYMEKITIEAAAKETGLSASHFMKYFKNTMGTSFINYLNEYRLTMAQRLLVSSESSILAIAEECGFENLSYFNRIFKKRYAQTPREYRKNFIK